MVTSEFRPLTSRFLLPLIFVSLVCFAAALGQPANFLVVKYGDETATQSMAEEFLDDLAGFLSSSLGGRQFEGWIANTPELAARILREKDPVIAFVPPGFYLQHFAGPTGSADVLVQVPRFGATSEHYYIVASKAGKAKPGSLKGRTVYTTFSFDEAYLKRVVFPSDLVPGRDFRLRSADNLSDAMFLLLEGAPDFDPSTTAILLDEELKAFFQQDDLVWPSLQVVWQSKDLPRDIVAALGTSWKPGEKENLKRALLEMKGSPQGAKLLELMSSDGMQNLDARQFADAAKAYSTSR